MHGCFRRGNSRFFAGGWSAIECTGGGVVAVFELRCRVALTFQFAFHNSQRGIYIRRGSILDVERGVPGFLEIQHGFGRADGDFRGHFNDDASQDVEPDACFSNVFKEAPERGVDFEDDAFAVLERSQIEMIQADGEQTSVPDVAV